MLCRHKEKFEYVVASRDNASYILDQIGFGTQYCKQTYDRDKRYGEIGDKEIQYGFGSSMHGCIPYGNYVIFGYYFDDQLWRHMTKKEFDEDFEDITPNEPLVRR